MMLSARRTVARRNPRRGAVTVLVALCLVAVLAFAAISLDGGMLLERRRKAQAAADAAALAAAESLFRRYPYNQGLDVDKTASNAAHAIAEANGFENDGTKSIVTVRTHPQTYTGGANVGLTLPEGYVEVTVQYNQ